ncbi:hypothetical protein PHMEG_00036623 [Phytophthora megakarya]|uniref:Uncharacterized protein n=1 Tax=Phytophthora megakarya TaxID=4795 RepID=A0A225UKS7_9STRA|nr:hypothetical protein PHMEG_00036623 [Phytophthora megakarya]
MPEPEIIFRRQRTSRSNKQDFFTLNVKPKISNSSNSLSIFTK